MNLPALKKCIFSLRVLSRPKFSYSIENHISYTCSQNTISKPANKDENINRSEPHYKKYKGPKRKTGNISSKVSDSQLSKFISTGKNNPDCFGTLSNDWKLQQELDALPDEENDIVEKEFLFNREGKTKLTINQYAKIIKQFLKQKKIGQAIDVLETRMLKDDKVQPDGYIYNLLIGACGEVGYTKKAFKLYKQMKDRGLKVTGHTYTGLFNSCANSPFPDDGLQRAQRLREILIEKGVLMNQIIYHSMVKVYGRCGDLETAFMLVDEMADKKVGITNSTFNFLLQACITDKTAGFRHALLVWWKMKQNKLRPTLYSFNLLLRCCRDCGLGDDESTQQVIQVLLQTGNRNKISHMIEAPSVDNPVSQLMVSENHSNENLPNLISSQPSMGNVLAVKNITSPEHRLMLMGGWRGILEQMHLSKVNPDIKTFTQLLDQIPSLRIAEEELLDAIKQAQVAVDVDFCNMLIKRRCFRSDYESAKDVLNFIKVQNLKPNVMTFGTLAMACQSSLTAQQLLQDIDNLGYRPNVEILGTLLKNACCNRDCDFVINMMKTLVKEGLKPNEIFINHLDKFNKYASAALSNEVTDNKTDLKLDGFKKFSKYYQSWRQNIRPDEPPHHWSQFEEVHMEPEDKDLMNYGKVTNVK